jgi:hypothetical protein
VPAGSGAADPQATRAAASQRPCTRERAAPLAELPLWPGPAGGGWWRHVSCDVVRRFHSLHGSLSHSLTDSLAPSLAFRAACALRSAAISNSDGIPAGMQPHSHLGGCGCAIPSAPARPGTVD